MDLEHKSYKVSYGGNQYRVYDWDASRNVYLESASMDFWTARSHVARANAEIALEQGRLGQNIERGLWTENSSGNTISVGTVEGDDGSTIYRLSLHAGRMPAPIRVRNFPTLTDLAHEMRNYNSDLRTWRLTEAL